MVASPPTLRLCRHPFGRGFERLLRPHRAPIVQQGSRVCRRVRGPKIWIDQKRRQQRGLSATRPSTPRDIDHGGNLRRGELTKCTSRGCTVCRFVRGTLRRVVRQPAQQPAERPAQILRGVRRERTVRQHNDLVERGEPVIPGLKMCIRDSYYRVSFAGSYLEIPASVQWGDGNGWQSAVQGEEPKVKPLRAAYADVDTTWAPVVSSVVTSKFVSVGERHSDDVIFAAAPEAPGISGTWRWRVSELSLIHI